MNKSVQPGWCSGLPIQQQSVLLLGARGPDGIGKKHSCKDVQRAYRACVFVAAKYGRSLEFGEEADGFMSLDLFGDDRKWKQAVNRFFDEVDSLPHHFIMHLLLGIEILGYKHPDDRFRTKWGDFYLRGVGELHLTPETEEQMDERLSDWERVHW